MEIEILSREVRDQIAAGEVVERPSHLIKELVENSLDAGTTQLLIDFSEGGRRVFIQDNGSGIPRDQLPRAVERFATSKIRLSEDLWKLNSFGFRGEALASIAAVSKMKIRSRTRNQNSAAQMDLEFGEVKEVQDVGGGEGTSIWIEDLFTNVPARLKFMKSESAEHNQIRTTLKALALAHHQVEFRILERGQLAHFFPPVSSRKERVEQVLNVAPLFEGFAQRENVKAWAVMASPDEVAKTSKNIWLLAQNRWIQDRTLQAAVMEAYRNLLMHGEFPQAVVWVETEPDQIDVNIHPTKSQVKFANPSLAFRAVQASLRDTLELAPWLKTSPSSSSPSSFLHENLTEPQFHQQFHQEALKSHANETPSDWSQVQYRKLSSFEGSIIDSKPSNFDKQNFIFKNEDQISEKVSLETLRSVALEKPWSRLQVLGQAHLTYILAQDENNLVLIDQHAAHERVAFEKLMETWKQGTPEIQEALIPSILDLSSEKMEALLSEQKNLEKLGVLIEAAGPQSLAIRGTPTQLKDSAVFESLEVLAQEIVDLGASFQFEKKVADLCASMACHSVVRAGQALSLEQMNSLLLAMDEYPLSSYCPHGRPVSVKFSFQQLEKDFGRRA